VRAAQIDANGSAYGNLGALLLSHRNDTAARECFSALQLIESNPLIWVTLGYAFERESGYIDDKVVTDSHKSKLMLTNANNVASEEHKTVSAYNAYLAAMEVASPVDALVRSLLSLLSHIHYHDDHPEHGDLILCDDLTLT
jgi:hypothetical protein